MSDKETVAYIYLISFVLLPFIIYIVGYFYTKGSLNAKKDLIKNILIGKTNKEPDQFGERSESKKNRKQINDSEGEN